jgi:CBS domain containing-hemolysin-like protein
MGLRTTLLILGGLLALSALLSASETALFSLNRIQLRRFQGSRRGRDRLVVRLLEHPADLLAAILVANTLVNVAFSALITDFFLNWLGFAPQRAALWATVVASAAIILGAEITPKTLAIRKAFVLAPLLAFPLRLVTLILRPVVLLLSRIAHAALRLVGIRDLKTAVKGLTPAELKALFAEAGEDQVLSRAEREIAGRIFEFSSTRAAEVMTPRVDIRSADRRVSREALAEVIRTSRHTRIPISDGSIDQIVGFVTAKEYLLRPDATLEEILKPVLIVPETKRVNEIFHEIQRRRIGMVVVVDEYGHTAGIITKEDLVEEIVGEIYDEYESESAPIVKVGPDRFLVTGQVTVDELAGRLGLSFETDAVTLNGLLADLLGDIPRPGDRVAAAGATFVVLEVRRHRVHRCEVLRAAAGSAAAAACGPVSGRGGAA